MILEFATKININGNRKYLGIDTDLREYSRERGHWFCKEDIVEIKASDLKKLEAECENKGYKKVPHMWR